MNRKLIGTMFCAMIAFADGLVCQADEVATRFYRNNPAGTGELLGAMEFKSLELAWAFQTEIVDPEDWGYLVPVVGDGRVFYAANDKVECLNAFNGKKLWTVKHSGMQFQQRGLGNRFNGIGHVVSTDGRIVLVPTENGRLYGLNATNGQTLWIHRSEGWISNPVLVGQTAYFTDNYGLVALNIPDGRELWRLNAGGTPEPESMVVVSDGRAYYATEQGILHGVSLDTREREWSCELWHEEGSSLNGTFCLKEGIIYLSTVSGLRGHSKSKKLFKVDARDGTILLHRLVGSDPTRTGLQTDGQHLIVFGLHNPGCLHASDLSPAWKIRRAATNPPDRANSYDMQYGGVTIVGNQILYVNYLKDAPFWVSDITTGRAIFRVRHESDPNYTTRAFRAPSGFFPEKSLNGWIYVGAGGGILGFKGQGKRQ